MNRRLTQIDGITQIRAKKNQRNHVNQRFRQKRKGGLGMSSSEWKKVRLGDVIEFNPKEIIAKGQVAKKIAMEKLKPYTKFIENYEMAEFNGGTKFKNGDTLLARITPCLENGKTAQVTMLAENEVGFGSTEYIVLREKENITDKDFIYYLAINPSFRNIAIKSMVGSSGRQRVQQDVLENTEILLPHLSEQKAIANTLSCLDDKIELNNRINKTLEEMAQAIFKSWFVDFEPFQDGEFEDSDMGRIPKGWRVKLLRENVKISTKSINPQNKVGVIFEHFSIPAYDECKMPVFQSATEIKSNKYIISSTCFLVSKLNPSTKRIWKPDCMTKNAICSTEFMVYGAINLKYTDFYYSLVNHNAFSDFIVGNATGSTNSRQRVIPNTTLNYKYICPIEDEIIRFVDIVKPIYLRIQEILIENKSLEQTRNILLPKLMSGEIRVPV